jgi:inner membrane protein
MMALTHCMIGAAAAAFALSPSPMAMGLAVLGSQLPDIDTSNSWIGSVLFPVSKWIEKRYPHRTITHCLLCSLLLLLLSGAAGYLLPDLLPNNCWLALPIGHVSACFADCFTKQGVQLFYPKPAWCVSGLNPNRRLSTGSVGEYSVLAVAIVALALNIHLHTSGGWVRATVQAIGLREGAIEVYNSESAKRHVFAEIEGNWVSDRSSANGRYWVLGTEGGEFVIADSKGIYKTASNIIINRLVTKPAGEATTISKTLTFNDQELQQELQQVQLEHPQSAIYLSGNLSIDFPEEVPRTAKPNQLQTLNLSGNGVFLNYCPIDAALIQLQGQYVTGTITAKIITPKPI